MKDPDILSATRAPLPDLLVFGLTDQRANNTALKVACNAISLRIPVLLLCAEQLPAGDEQQLLEEGVVDIITYPKNREELMVCAKQIIQVFKSSDRIQQWMQPLQDAMAPLHRDVLLANLGNLRPYLTKEGRNRLSVIGKQLKWELNSETQFNSMIRFDRTHAALFDRLKSRCPSLTKNEKRLCAYLLHGYSATEISHITDRTLNSINVAFARIRIKMNVASNKELKEILLRLNSRPQTPGHSIQRPAQRQPTPPGNLRKKQSAFRFSAPMAA